MVTCLKRVPQFPNTILLGNSYPAQIKDNIARLFRSFMQVSSNCSSATSNGALHLPFQTIHADIWRIRILYIARLQENNGKFFPSSVTQ